MRLGSDVGRHFELVKNSIRFSLPKSIGGRFAKDEEEDGEHEEDRAPAAEPDQPLDGRLDAVATASSHGRTLALRSACRAPRGSAGNRRSCAGSPVAEKCYSLSPSGT